MTTLKEMMAGLPPARRAKIEGRARELIGEEIALQRLRKARHLTQEQMARALGIGQDSVSRLESRSDLLISTLRSYIQAMGGDLKIVAEFKDGSAVISGLMSSGPLIEAKKVQKRPPQRRKRHLQLAHTE